MALMRLYFFTIGFLQNVSLKRVKHDKMVETSRITYDEFALRSNGCYCLEIDKFRIRFPYGYCLADCYDEVLKNLEGKIE